jgi:hypothetical protein
MQAHEVGIVDTVGELRARLANHPDDMPVTARYDGTRRIAVGFSTNDPDTDATMVTFHEVTQHWLEAHGLPVDNPRFEG